MAENAENLVSLTIDGVQLRVPKGTLLVEAAKQIRREIPVYCYHTKMGPAGLCRICLVEIEGIPKLQIGCNTTVTEGMVVRTQSDKAADGRRAVLEFYLKNHPLDCPICDKGGECDLQDYAMAYGQDYSRSIDPKLSKPKAVDLGPTIVLDEERCVVCQRCVRFDDMIVGERELVLKDRGVRNIIATATGEEYRHNFTGNVTELCPVGALTSKTYRFKSRPWDLRRATTTCVQCPVGCQMHVDVRVGKVQRTMSVETDDAISDTWLCDRGRYNIGFYDDAARIKQPLFKHEGQFVQIGWDDAIDLWSTAIRAAVKANPASAGAIGGGRLTNEEAYLLQLIFRAQGVQNLDWRAGRQRQATPDRNAGKLTDLENADAIVIAGESPAERAPIMDLRIRKAGIQHGAKIVRIASLERPYPPPVGGLDVRSVAEAIAALPKNAKRIAIVWDGVDLALGKALADSMPSGATVLTYVTGEQPNARGAEAMGMLPQKGAMDTDAMLIAACEGNLAVLSIFGANPALHHPNGEFVREALSNVPFVAVTELFMTETAKLATLILPAKAGFEKDGTTTNLAGDLLPLNAAPTLESPPDALSDLEILIALGEKLGAPLPTIEEVDAKVVELVARPPDPALGDERFARTVVEQPGMPAVDGALRVALQTHVFAGGGTSANDDRLPELRPLPQASISQSEAERLKIATGDYIDIARDGRTMHDLLVEVRGGMPEGVIALLGGLPDDPANLFGEGALVEVVNVRSSSERDVVGSGA